MENPKPENNENIKIKIDKSVENEISANKKETETKGEVNNKKENEFKNRKVIKTQKKH